MGPGTTATLNMQSHPYPDGAGDYPLCSLLVAPVLTSGCGISTQYLAMPYHNAITMTKPQPHEAVVNKPQPPDGAVNLDTTSESFYKTFESLYKAFKSFFKNLKDCVKLIKKLANILKLLQNLLKALFKRMFNLS